MRRTLLAGATALAACGVTGTVFAADLPPRAPVYAPPAIVPAPYYNWSGFYLGAHIGWGTARKEWAQTFPTTGLSVGNGTSFDADGVIGGGQIGYNWQTGNWVFGVEADFTGSGLSGTGTQVNTPTWTDKTDVNWFGTAVVRAGYAWDRVLVYALGGFAWADETHQEFFSGGAAGGVLTLVGTTDNTHTGWTVGGGVEVGLWDNWTGKVQYNYFDLGTENVAFTNVPPAPAARQDSFDISQRFHMVKFGLNYRWGGLRF